MVSAFYPQPEVENDLESARLPHSIAEGFIAERMYAIAFDLDTDTLRKSCPGNSWNNAYQDIHKVLKRHGFEWQQGSVYFGNAEVNAVTCVLAVMECTRSLVWFASSIRDIRMLRIEELNDLMPAVKQALGE